MVTTEIKNSLRHTLNELRVAENELNRPVEDVVTLSLCLTARRSMNTLMHNFLISNNVIADRDLSLQHLLAECKKLDKNFEKVDLSKIFCNGLNHSQCEDKHCLTYNNVEECVTVAKGIKDIVLEKLNIRESELL